MKKSLITLLITILLLTFSVMTGCTSNQNDSASGSTFTFTDSCSRTVELPKNIDRIAVSGPLSQLMCFALCPDKLVELSSEWDDTLKGYLDPKYLNLPVLGNVYNKGNINLEELLNTKPQVIIDIGESKKNIVEDMDTLSELTGIPCVHIDSSLENMPEAFEKLGELLNLPTEASALASYCQNKYDMCLAAATEGGKKELIYLTGEKGLNVIANGSFHAEVIDLIGNNIAVLESPSSKGTGTEVNIEQILNWNPEYIIFSANSIAKDVNADPAWAAVSAIKENKYYEVPQNPYNWIGAPSSIQRHLNLLWFTKTLYPDTASFDLYESVREYISAFYHFELPKADYDSWN